MGLPQRQSADIRQKAIILISVLNQNGIIICSTIYRYISMTPDRQPPLPTTFTISSLEQQYNNDIPTLSRTRTFSFQAPPQQSSSYFCTTFLTLQTLDTISKRILDSNVVTLNSTQKEMVQTIVQTNKNREDQKSKYLTQRANKFLKILWKAEKYSNCCLDRVDQAKQEKMPRYASPIRHFKQHKLTRNNSFGTGSNQASRTKSGIKKDKDSFQGAGQATKPARLQKVHKQSVQTSRARHFNSQDKKFERIRLSPNPAISRLKPGQPPRQKSFEIDLTQNITWKTMLTTKNFQNMLKVLKP